VYDVHGWFALYDSTYQSDREHEATLAAAFPGAYGLLDERDDEPGLPGGTEAFTVPTLARGRVAVHTDLFLAG